MFTTLLGRRKPSAERLDLAARRYAWPDLRTRPPAPQKAMDDRLYFAVRSYAGGGRHVLQYAFCDDRGNVVFSALASASGPILVDPGVAAPDMAVDPLSPEALEHCLVHVCRGANLVAFGRVLQSGLLPAAAISVTASIDCAWRRFLKVGRQRRVAFDRSEPLMLSDAMAAANLPPLDSEDAALRSLAVRDLWTWMDRLELQVA